MKKGAHKNFIMLLGLSVTHITSAIFNRIVMAKFFFNFPIFINILQYGSLLFILEIARSQNLTKIQPYTIERGKDLMIPSILYSISTYLTLISLDGVSLHMFPTMTKLAPLIAVGIIFFLSEDRDTLTLSKIGTVGGIALTSSFSTYFFYSYQPTSWSYGLLVAIILPYSFRLFYLQSEKYSIEDVIYINSFNCFITFMISDLMMDEVKFVFYYYQTSTSIMFYISLLCQTITGVLSYIFLMYIIKKLGLVTATVTYTFLQTIQLLFAYLLSLVLFYDITPTFFNIMNMCFCFACTLYYFKKYCHNISFKDRSNLKYTMTQNKR
uniref:TPT domain-containing protein n=1 Tax=Parastrongyloides trichosuri TaxID=131310 RepID=A0A0N5A3Y4_PARTI